MVAAFAYLMAVIQALLSMAGLAGEWVGVYSEAEAALRNSKGIYIARWAGMVIVIHMSGVLWLTALRAAADGDRVKGDPKA